MKKKLLTLLLTLVALAAFAGVGISAAAAGTKDAVTVKNANWSARNMVAFETDTDSILQFWIQKGIYWNPTPRNSVCTFTSV